MVCKTMEKLPKFGIIYLVIFVFINIFSTGCDRNDRFYRPNLPEKLCCIGIIDADDTVRYITFEKSFQEEYSDASDDTLKELSFSIFSTSKHLFSNNCDSNLKNPSVFKIPDSIDFKSGDTYYLNVSEKSTSPISAEVVDPESPSIPELISMNKETVPALPTDFPCHNLPYSKSLTLGFSFANTGGFKYYAILLEGFGYSFHGAGASGLSFLDYSVRECNTPGFFSPFYGIRTYHILCDKDVMEGFQTSTALAYMIDGSKIPGSNCTITISTQFANGYAIHDILKYVRIKVISVPKSFYQFEKSLYTYKQISKDPFAEPNYLNGNIKEGNGVFAVCRSKQLTINFSPLF